MSDTCVPAEAFAQDLGTRHGPVAPHCVIFRPPESNAHLLPLQQQLRGGVAAGRLPAVRVLAFRAGCGGGTPCAVALLAAPASGGDAAALAGWLRAQPGVSDVRLHALGPAAWQPGPAGDLTSRSSCQVPGA